MQIIIEIPESEIPKRQNIIEIPLHFIDGKVCEAGGYGYDVLPKGHGDLIDVNRKITVPIYDEQYEEWGVKTLTVREALNRWSDEGITVKDVVILADETGGEDKE